MARPLKQSADYFLHQSNLRNNERLIAIREEFGAEGYGVYIMLLEKVCESDNFSLPFNDTSIRLYAGDIRIKFDKLKAILQACIDLELFTLENGIIICNYLQNYGLKYLLEKREKTRQNRAIDAEINLRNTNPNLCDTNPDLCHTNTQSRVEYITHTHNFEKIEKNVKQCFDDSTLLKEYIDEQVLSFIKYYSLPGRSFDNLNSKIALWIENCPKKLKMQNSGIKTNIPNNSYKPQLTTSAPKTELTTAQKQLMEYKNKLKDESAS